MLVLVDCWSLIVFPSLIFSTTPITRRYQRKGYGKFLIEFSYALSKIEGKVGSPEKPLSDLGQLAYYPYWEEQLLLLLADNKRSGQEISIMDICNATSFKPDDVLAHFEGSIYFDTTMGSMSST